MDFGAVVFVVIGLIVLVLLSSLEGSGKNTAQPPAKSSGRLSVDQSGQLPGEGGRFRPETNARMGAYVSPAARAEWQEKIDALGLVVGSPEWDAYKERKENEQLYDELD